MSEKTEKNPKGAGRKKLEGIEKEKVQFSFESDIIEILQSKKKGTKTTFVEESIRKNPEMKRFMPRTTKNVQFLLSKDVLAIIKSHKKRDRTFFVEDCIRKLSESIK